MTDRRVAPQPRPEDRTAGDTPLSDYPRVQVWFDGLERSWGPNADAEKAEKLGVLARFCALAGKNPDEMVSECLRPVENGMEKIRYKARHLYIGLIDEFEGGAGESRASGNVVRSFFIHNGVSMGGRVLRG